MLGMAQRPRQDTGSDPLRSPTIPNGALRPAAFAHGDTPGLAPVALRIQLLDAQGNRRKTWRIAMGKRGWSERTIWDSRRAQWVRASVLARPLRHAEHPDSPLWLVVCREPRTHSLVSVDRRTHQHRRRRLARGVYFHAELPD